MSTPDPSPLVEVARYDQLADAREAALVLAAKDLAYTIEREGKQWLIHVDEPFAQIARAELDAYAKEERARPAPPAASPLEKVRTAPLFVAGWILSGFFLAQQMLGETWTRSGAAVSRDILRGEWWRTITALTLHGDLPSTLGGIAAKRTLQSALPRLSSARLVCWSVQSCGPAGLILIHAAVGH